MKTPAVKSRSFYDAAHAVTDLQGIPDQKADGKTADRRHQDDQITGELIQEQKR